MLGSDPTTSKGFFIGRPAHLGAVKQRQKGCVLQEDTGIDCLKECGDETSVLDYYIYAMLSIITKCQMGETVSRKPAKTPDMDFLEFIVHFPYFQFLKTNCQP